MTFLVTIIQRFGPQITGHNSVPSKVMTFLHVVLLIHKHVRVHTPCSEKSNIFVFFHIFLAVFLANVMKLSNSDVSEPVVVKLCSKTNIPLFF